MNQTAPQSFSESDNEKLSQNPDLKEVAADPQEHLAEDKTVILFPIIGIGASTGGLEALELFFNSVPPNNGMAFVIVQHLDPTHKGILAEILQRSTVLPIVQVTDHLLIEPNHVYVILPNKDMSVLYGALHLLPPSAPCGLLLPIDNFFRSLAEDLRERSVGVILSGMGSDGSIGLQAINEKGGAVFVQDPASAKFSGMPLRVINTGLVDSDIVELVDELLGEIIAVIQHKLAIPENFLTMGTKTLSTLKNIFFVILAQTVMIVHNINRQPSTAGLNAV